MADRRLYRPWLPVTVRADNQMPANDLEIRKTDAVALQALEKGIANEDQQKRAWAAILHITGINDLEFLPAEHGGERDSAFKSGKRHVGLQLRKLVSHSISILTGEAHDRSADTSGRRAGKPGNDRSTSRSGR